MGEVRRIVFAGISGIEKFSVAEKFREYTARMLRIPADAATMPIICAENMRLDYFLGEPLPSQRQILEDSYRSARLAIGAASNRPETKVIIVLLHHTFMDADRIFSPLSWLPHADPICKSLLLSFLEEFHPGYIVNLVNDIHYIQKCLKNRNPHTDLKLRDILKWRELEMLIADFAANDAIPIAQRLGNASMYPFECSPMFATRHDCASLYRYLFEQEIPRVYTSFLITEIRRPKTSADRRACMGAQVNNLTRKLSEEFCVFNPLTIDEKPLETLQGTPPLATNNAIYQISSAARHWDFPVEGTLTSTPVEDLEQLAISDVDEISTKHSHDNRTIVDRQVSARDFRLIDQSDCVVIYRPTNKLEPEDGSYWGGGCLAEFKYTQRSVHRPNLHVYFVVDSKDPKVDDVVGTKEGIFADTAKRTHVFVQDNLDDEPNQNLAIAEVIGRIKRDQPELTRYRTRSAVAIAR